MGVVNNIILYENNDAPRVKMNYIYELNTEVWVKLKKLHISFPILNIS